MKSLCKNCPENGLFEIYRFVFTRCFFDRKAQTHAEGAKKPPPLQVTAF